MLGSVVWSLTRLGTTLPGYSGQFVELYRQVLEMLAGFGIEYRGAAEGADWST